MKTYNPIVAGKPVICQDHFPVINPANLSTIAQCGVADSVTVDAAVTAARQAQNAWAQKPDTERQQMVMALADCLEANAGELARLLTEEQGKPLKGLGSEFEVGGAVAWTRATSSFALQDKIIEENAQQRVLQTRKPVGVVASITPWNYPVLIAIWHIIPALRVGCTVVLKPASDTPLATHRMVELFNEILPAGVLNLVTGSGAIGQQLSAHVDVDKLVFTGSIPVGKDIMQRSACNLKRLTLELGGNDAGIVLPDADIDAMIEGLFWGAFINTGQTCAALKRLYVHDSVYEALCQKFAQYVQTIPMGAGDNPDNLMGPLCNEKQFELIKSLVDDAKAQSATVLTGGKPLADLNPDFKEAGYFYPLTLIAEAKHGMRVVDEEQFGPVLPIIRYQNIEDAIAMANSCQEGLGGSVWSRNNEQAKSVARQLNCGTAWINKHAQIQPNIPFGGVKQSGFGVEFAEEGLHEYTTIQIINEALG